MTDPHAGPVVSVASDRGALAARAAGATQIALGLGFGIGGAWALRHLEAHGELPMTPWGFRALSGPFEQLGEERFVALGWTLVAVCAADIAAGAGLMWGRKSGFRLGLVTAGPSFLLGLGFALPFLLAGIPVRLALAFAGRRALR